MARVFLVSRTDGQELAARAQAFAPVHDVTLIADLPEPGDEIAARYFNRAHARSAATWKALAERCADGSPDYIEFCEPAEATVTVQARITGDRLLAGTRIAVRDDGSRGERPEAPLEAKIEFDMGAFALRNADSVVETTDDPEPLLAAPARPGPRPCDSGPLVSVIIPYYEMSEFIGRTVESVLAQRYRPIEVIVVNDGSFLPEDAVLLDLVEQEEVVLISRTNGGLGPARNFGIAQSRGDYVLPLDADNVIRPGFIERAVGILQARPEVAYVTAWSTYVDPEDVPLGDELGYQPIGNELQALDETNVAGDALAVIPRSVFRAGFGYTEELTNFEDRLLYRELAVTGRLGVVIPQRLIDYRVRDDSMFRRVTPADRERLLARVDEIVEERRRAHAG